jgi:hypothetical protein
MTSASDADVAAASELARKAHRTLEPLHAITYFAPEPGEEYAAAGLKGGMRQYFAVRSAPMGIVPVEVVIATFFNFAPYLIEQAIPSAWDDTTPEAMIAARYVGADRIYQRVLGAEVLGGDELAEAAGLARDACSVLGVEGRALYAGHAALPWPEPPHLKLFHAATLLREHRGDAHIGALVLARLDPVEALVTHLSIAEGMPYDMVRATRGWKDEDWDAGVVRCRERGLVDENSKATEAGLALRDQVETQTNAVDTAPYLHLGAEKTERLRELVKPWSRALAGTMFG